MYRSTFKIFKNAYALSRVQNQVFKHNLSTVTSISKLNLFSKNNVFVNQRKNFSDDSAQLEKDFQKALANLQNVTSEVDNNKKLLLYALYKQGTIGICSGEKPSMFNVVEKAKYQAWKNLGDLNSDEAKKQYITIVNELLNESKQESSTKEPELIFEERDHVYWIKLNRPKQLNAITPEIYEGVIDALKRSGEDPDIKFTVITGTGKYFSSGNDLKNFVRMGKEFNGDVDKATQHARDLCQRFVGAFIDFPKPLIGAVNGPAFGIMFTTLGLCDCVIASDKASFTCPFSSLGQSPEGCSTHTFPQIFGTSLASELLYFNYAMPVEEAHKHGFVSRIVPSDNFESHLEEWLYSEKGLVKTCFPNSMINAKAIVRNDEKKLLLHEINKVECDVLQQSWKSEECMEALQRFYSRKN